MIWFKKLKCLLRGYHYLDNMGGIWCCHECGTPLDWRTGSKPRWRAGGPWE